MSHKLDILENVDRTVSLGGYGYLFGFPLANSGKSYTAGTGVPIDGIKGYARAALWWNLKGGGLYYNTGTKASATWTLIPGTGVVGVATGYKIARGQHTQVAASDTIVTGLTTVVSVTASFDSSPTVKQLFLAASIGDQAGTPAAGSILLKTFKPTAVDNVTPIAATDFTENLKIDWIAVGT